MTKIFLSSSAENLKTALTTQGFKRVATVEAEYGDVLVEGFSDVEDDDHTLAHHGPRTGNLCPCLEPNREADLPPFEAFGLSHFDLDAMGGVLALMSQRPESSDDERAFWRAAAFIDINGPHKAEVYFDRTSHRVRNALHAWWAWSEKHRCYAPRDGSVAEISGFFDEAKAALTAILAGDEALHREGILRSANEKALNVSSFVRSEDGVVFRTSTSFVNHLYACPGNTQPERAVVSYNPETRAVTLSLADPVEGVSCRDLALALWGEKAGGHAGIAGGPREGLDDGEAIRAFQILRLVLRGRKFDQ